MIRRTVNWLHRYLDLQAEEQVIPRKLESINPTLTVDVDYFWETVGPTLRENFIVDHSAGDIETLVIDFKEDLDTLLIDWTWVNNGGANFYFANWDLVDINRVDETTIWRERINGTVSPGVVTRTNVRDAIFSLYPNQFTQPRLIRSTEQLNFFVDNGGAGATVNELRIRTVSFPKNGPLPRLAF